MVSSSWEVLKDDVANDYQRRAINHKFERTEIKIQHNILPIPEREKRKKHKIFEYWATKTQIVKNIQQRSK